MNVAVDTPGTARPEARAEGTLSIWLDLTNSPHVVIFRPLIERLRARGHEVTVTARDFAQTLGLLDRYGIPHRVFGAHGGALDRLDAVLFSIVAGYYVWQALSA